MLYLTGCQDLQKDTAKQLACAYATGARDEANINLRSFHPHVKEFLIGEDPDFAAIWKGQELTRDVAQRIVDFCELPDMTRLRKELRPKGMGKQPPK